MIQSFLSRCVGLVLFTTLIGCGGPSNTAKPVAGTITFDGKPIVYGQIEFIPNANQNHSGPAGSAEIVDGKFDTKVGGQGIHYGPHQVRVTAYESRPPATNNDETVTVDSPPPLFVGFTVPMDIKSPEVTITVPLDAKGFNLFEEAKPTRRANDP